MFGRLLFAIFVCTGLNDVRAADDLDRFFRPVGPISVFQVNVDKENLDQLRRDPRKHVRATVTVGGHTYHDVGMHLKGAAGSFRPWEDKPALTLSFDHFDKKQHFHDMDKIHLNNSVQDSRYMTEFVCGHLMLEAGVPTARATHALVELNGRKVGLYVVKEGYDSAFLKHHFGSSAGNLYDGGFLSDIDQPLKRTHGAGDVEDRLDLKAAAAASRERDLAQRFGKVEKLVDIDKFMLMAALEVITVHWDGYAPHKNNYKVYHDLKSGKLVFIPHGMDQMYGDPNWPTPPGFEGLIARKLMETTEGKERFRKAVEKVMEKNHNPAEIHALIDERVTWLKEQLEPINKGLTQQIENENRGLKDAIRARDEVVRKQLAKK